MGRFFFARTSCVLRYEPTLFFGRGYAVRKPILMAAVVMGALVALPLAGCSSTSASPLEVTYYYLPG